MLTIKNSIEINAPVEKIYRYLLAAENLPEVWRGMEEVTNLKPLPNGGHSFDWTYKMAGVRLKGHCEDEVIEECKRTVSRSNGGIESRITWSYEVLSPDSTRVTNQTDYTVPIPVIGKLAEAMVHKMNQRDVETLLANLKTRMEG